MMNENIKKYKITKRGVKLVSEHSILTELMGINKELGKIAKELEKMRKNNETD